MDKKNQPRYQIFVSSTFRDLKEEREAVLNAILKLHQFPMGMETFPAANSTPWELIERLIEDSDYYVLIIGGKYGSVDDDGVSYTEKEYDLAVKLGRHILVFMHESPENIPINKSDLDPDVKMKLDAFRKKASKHHVNTWTNAADLQIKVLASLSLAIANFPQVGWVKASGQDNKDLMRQIIHLHMDMNKMSAKFTELEAKNKELQLFNESILAEMGTNDLAGGEDKILIKFRFSKNRNTKFRISELETTWDDVFYGLANSMKNWAILNKIESEYSSYISEHYSEFSVEGTDSNGQKLIGQIEVFVESPVPTADQILDQFILLGLVENKEGIKYKLTTAGLNKYLRYFAFYKSDDNQADEL